MILGVIPARFASTRFPGKPLVEIQGVSMIQRVYRQALMATKLDKVVVATDDERIYQHVLAFGGVVHMTAPSHPSGTDRCAEVASLYPDASLVVNIQGDEPFIQPQQIDLLIDTLLGKPDFSLATLAKKIETPEALHNPNTVKVVFSPDHSGLYFSRHAIPYFRNDKPENWLDRHTYYKHIGMYAYRKNTLFEISKLSPTPLELAESLEQLRWLENGYAIAVGITELETIGIDTPEDLLKIN